MSPERKAQLEARMLWVIELVNRKLVAEGSMSPDVEPAKSVHEELAEIAACIGTTFLALNWGAKHLTQNKCRADHYAPGSAVPFHCTLPKGHAGDHIAEGSLTGAPLRRWPQ